MDGWMDGWMKDVYVKRHERLCWCGAKQMNIIIIIFITVPYKLWR
jgi:hypothetical protein